MNPIKNKLNLLFLPFALLKLNDPQNALWGIGPYDMFRGQDMATVCEKSAADINVYYGDFKALPNTNPEDSLRAFVKGTFTGNPASPDSKPFLITNGDLIVASGHIWVMDKYPKFFALVEPNMSGKLIGSQKPGYSKDGNVLGL